MRVSRNTFVLAGIAGALAAGGAIATGSSSFADTGAGASSSLGSSNSAASSPGSTSPASVASSSANTSPTGSPLPAHVTVTPRLTLLSGHRAQLSVSMSGYVYTRYASASDAVYYLGGFDGDLDGLMAGGEAMGCGSPGEGPLTGHHLRGLTDHTPVQKLAPGRHTWTVYVRYCTEKGMDNGRGADITRSFVVGDGGAGSTSTSPPSSPGRTSPGASHPGSTATRSPRASEPPTPAPATTTLGVTG